MKKITMQDIANHLNISKNSVSQALRDKGTVSEQTKALVRQTANEMGYTYQKSPKETTSTPKTLAFVASETILSDGISASRNFFTNIYLSLQKEVIPLGWDFQIVSIPNDKLSSMELPLLLTEKKVDYLILLSHLTDGYTNKLLALGLPTVIIDHHYPLMQADAILTNNRFGSYVMMQHLIELGHTHIGFMGNIHRSPSYQERYEGYLLALQKHNLPIPDDCYVLTDITETDKAIVTTLNNLDKQPSVWFCVNDALGFFTHNHLKNKGFVIPDDIAICNYDNGDLSNLVYPRITTMDIDLEYYGRAALDQLLWRIAHPEMPYREILISSTLLIKGSTKKFS